MDLILWRHAEAHLVAEGQADVERALTPKGERQAERMAQWLNQRLTHSTRILVSPALRCQQTAQALGKKFKTVNALAPDASTAMLLHAVRWPESSAAVLVVGHQPTLGLTAAQLLTNTPQQWSVKKGAVWWLRYRQRDADSDGGPSVGNCVVLQAMQVPDWL
jgi:phosphohistidine phosphatase